MSRSLPITPCPVCGAPYGFHDDEPHDATNDAIPAHLKRPSNTALRREAKAKRPVWTGPRKETT